MRRFLISSLAAGAACAMAFAAQAGEPYTQEDVVQFFAKSADLGAARGICIGTEDECNQGAKPAGFDMLISFELDSAELTEQARENLEIFAKALKDDRLRAAKFLVEGHTDASGDETYNETLAERRAASVVSFLLDRGIENGKLTPVGMGERAPRTENPYAPENRRVEMRISLQ